MKLPTAGLAKVKDLLSKAKILSLSQGAAPGFFVLPPYGQKYGPGSDKNFFFPPLLCYPPFPMNFLLSDEPQQGEREGKIDLGAAQDRPVNLEMYWGGT